MENSNSTTLSIDSWGTPLSRRCGHIIAQVDMKLMMLEKGGQNKG
jgi:hypothetical protein